MKLFTTIAATVAVASAAPENVQNVATRAQKVDNEIELKPTPVNQAFHKLTPLPHGWQAPSMTMANVDLCGEKSECADEWKSQRWGKKTWTSHCQAKLDGGYHIDCNACDWCEKKAPDGQIVRKELKGTPVAPIKIEHPEHELFKVCDVQNCANWECKEWCHCFDEKAEYYGLYEHHGCDEDDSSAACECETTGNGATFSEEDKMFLQKRSQELMKKRLATMEVAATHKFVAAKHK